MPRSERIARLLVLPLALLFGFLLLRGSGSATDPVTTDGDEGGATTAPDGTAPDDTTPETTTTTAPPRTTTTTTAAPPTTRAPATTRPPAAVPDLPPARGDAAPEEPRAVYRDGAVTLVGSVPDAGMAAGYARKLTSVVGSGNVAVELTRDERVSGRPLRIEVDRAFRLPEPGAGPDPGLDSLVGVAGEVLAAMPESTLVITGHTDAVGTEATNLALSIARARLVVEDLVARGLPRERLVADGAGETQPVATNDTPEGRLENRRITAAFDGVTPD